MAKLTLSDLQAQLVVLQQSFSDSENCRKQLPHGYERETLWHSRSERFKEIETLQHEIEAVVCRFVEEQTPRTCILCEYMTWSSGDHAYSDVTPETAWEANCQNGHWEMQGYDVTEETYRATLLKAVGCPDFCPSHLLATMRVGDVS